MKTIKQKRPSMAVRVRLVSGRNSPDYSYGISDPRSNADQTGDAVLSIWNARVDQSMEQFKQLRLVVLVRNFLAREFAIFEQPVERFPTGDFRWLFNQRGNLEGFDRASDDHRFTWQPHGSQFTIIRPVPGSVRSFRVDRPVPECSVESILEGIGFDESWIETA